jgi:hypothetical protein
MANAAPHLLERLAALSGAASVAVVTLATGLIDDGGKGLYPDQSPGVIGREFGGLVTEARWGASLLLVAVVLELMSRLSRSPLSLWARWSPLRAPSC